MRIPAHGLPIAVTIALCSWLAACTVGCGQGWGSGTPRPSCSAQGPIGSLCGFSHPQDIEFVPGPDVVLVSNYRFDGRIAGGGFISAFTPGRKAVTTLWPTGGEADAAPEAGLGDGTCDQPPVRGAFYPHGITSARHDGRMLVYVVAHKGESGGREAVEVFELRDALEGHVLSWKACIPTEGELQANDIAVAVDGELIVSNYQADGSLMNRVKAMLFGEPTGNVMAWRKGSGWRRVEGTDAALATGVAVTPDGFMLLYTETATGSLYRVPRDGSQAPIKVDIGGNPHHLAWTTRGTLLTTAHTDPISFALCLFGRTPCKSAWKIVEVDPRTLVVEDIIEHDGEVVGAVSSALEVGDRIYLASAFDDRIGILTLDSLTEHRF